MVQCEKCHKSHEGLYGSGRFCTSQCARSFATSKNRLEIHAKIAASLKGRKSAIPIASRRCSAKKATVTKYAQLMGKDFEHLSRHSKKTRIILEQKGLCLICGISDWQGKDLTLALDHINGDNTNDSRLNLRALCPNCHSQTETYCGKHKPHSLRKGEYLTPDELLLAALLKHRSVAQALKSLGRSRSGKVYERCKELLTKHNISKLVDIRPAHCSFCDCVLNIPKEEETHKFCSNVCAGKYRAKARKENRARIA